MKKTVGHRDLLEMSFLAAPELSPNGGDRVAYAISRADLDADTYRTDVWIHDLGTDEGRRLTTRGDVAFHRWGRDGESVLVATKAEGRTHLLSVPIDGTPPRALFEIPHEASDAWDLGEGRYLVMARFAPTTPEQLDEAGPKVFDELPLMANGKGWISGTRMGLGTWDMAKGVFTRVTPPTMDVSRVTLSEDRATALVVACDYEGTRTLDNGVWQLDIARGTCEELTRGLAFTFSCAIWDEDGDVLVTATDRKAWGANEDPKLWLLERGALTCLSPGLDVSMGHPIVADTSYGCRDHAGEIAPGPMGPICCATVGFKARLCAIVGGELRTLTPSVSSVIDWHVQGERVAYVAYEGLHLPELWILEGGKERRLTSHNDALFDERILSQPIHVTFEGLGGAVLDGWYMRPVGYREGDRCPAILHIHGGPKAAFGDIYHHEMQCWAARGYAVIYCDPRGSDGRGGAFADIRGRYGQTDYRDVMDFTDWCVKELRSIDASRMGVTGGSYGGFLTNWIITRTNRFRAAVSQRGISNWISKFGSCDIGWYYVEDQHLGTPWRDAWALWRESPLAYADRARTPTLFVHSTQDLRCELDQAKQMFTALRANGVEARLCVFEGEDHELSRSGRPRARLARLRAIAEWFDQRVRLAR